MKRRILCIQIAIIFVLTTIPGIAFADTENDYVGAEQKIIEPEAGDEYSANEVIVVYNDRATAGEIKSYTRSIAKSSVETYTELELQYSVVEIPEDTDLADAMKEYAEDPTVAYVQPNYRYHLIDESVVATKNGSAGKTKKQDADRSAAESEDPVAESSASTKQSANVEGITADAYEQWHLGDIYAGDAQVYCRGMAANKVSVAVIDTGVAINHPDLQASLNKSKCKDATGDEQPSALPALTKDYDVGDGHGTHVSGIVGATAGNGIGGTGVVNAIIGNSALDLFVVGAFAYYNENGVKVGGPGTGVELGAFTDDIIRAIKCAKIQGADVINMSLGSYDSDQLEKAAVDDCEASGITVVCAAGNDATSKASYPAAYPSTISVSALEMDSQGYISVADYSNYGKTINISAPGSGIISTIPTTIAISPPGYAMMSGTSMASPVVSGCAALMYAVNPQIKPAAVKNGLYKTAYDLYTKGWDQDTGYGDVDSEGAAWAAVQTLMPASPAAKTSLVGYDDIKVTWNAVSGAEKYRLYYKKASASKYTLLTTTNGRAYTKSNLADGVKYTFLAVPCKTVNKKLFEGTGYISNIYTLKKLATPKVTKYSKTKVKVSWSNIAGETGYQISKSSKKSGTSVISTYKTTTGKYKTFKVKKKKTYYYKVRAYKTVGTKKVYGPWSSPKAYKLK